MNKFIHEFHTAANDIRLTGAERRRIVANLRAAIEDASVPSPYWSFISMPHVAVGAFAMLLIIVTGGTALAAQDALPGDTLYPIKVSVMEPIQGALAISASAKAQWNAKVAASRLDEARALAAKGALTATTSAQLAVNFSEHADALPRSDAATFSSLVAAKSAALLDAGEGSGSATSTRASGSLVLAIADRHAETVSATISDANTPAAAAPEPETVIHPTMMMAPMRAKSAVSVTTAATTAEDMSDDTVLAQNLSIEAHDALSDATSTLARATLATSTAEEASARIRLLANQVVKAEAERAIGSTAEAITDFTRALTTAAEFHLFITGQNDTVSSGDSSSASASVTPLPI